MLCARRLSSNGDNTLSTEIHCLDQSAKATRYRGRELERSSWLRWVIVFAVVCMAPSQTFAAAAPNIVLIIVDDMSWNGMSLLMDPTVPGSKSDFYQTPNLAALANNGMRFSNGYSAGTVCSPTRAALMTGKSPAQLNHTDLKDSQPGTPRYEGQFVGLPLTPPTPELFDPNGFNLPRLIKQANPSYQTALLGKWHLDIPSTTTPTASGFDIFDDVNLPPDSVDPWGVQALSNKANALMTGFAASDTPFFIELAHRSPHPPVRARPGLIEKYENLPPGVVHNSAGYAAMMEDLDSSVGTVLAKIDELGIADNTYVVFTADHGAAQALSRSTPLRGGKATMWEGGIRVPYLFQGPGIAAGSVSDVPITTTDLFTTIGSWAGYNGPVPQGVEGADLSPVLENGGALPAGMDHLERQYAQGGELYFHSPNNQAVGTTTRIKPSSGVREGDFKLYVEYSETGGADRLFLYNLKTDIGETMNLAVSNPTKTAELKAKLDNYLEAVDASFAYDVKKPIQLAWDAGAPGADAAGWRSTIDAKYKVRETWKLNQGAAAPVRTAAESFQPGLANSAFVFDGADGMSGRFWHVADNGPRKTTLTPGTPDFDRSVSTQVWFRLDDLQHNQVLVESGDATAGLSLTLGNADGVGGSNNLRLRVRGVTGESIDLTVPINRFADPTKDFISATAVFNDSNDSRYVELYVNGALAGKTLGQLGAEHSLQWDSYDDAGLGNAGGTGLGANGGTGALPFTGGLRGEIAAANFYNYALTPAQVLSGYNSVLNPVNFGIASFGGGATSPSQRPSSVALGISEAAQARIVHERNDALDGTLSLDVRINADVTLRSNSMGSAGALPTGMFVSSYLVNFDPTGAPAGDQSVTGVVKFDQQILGVIFDDASLAITDAVLGSIGDFGATADRGLQLMGVGAGSDFLKISDDRRTLTFKLTTDGAGMQQFRVLTEYVNGGDFNGDGVVSGADLAIWKTSMGVNASGDADGDGDTDGADYLVWQSNFGTGVAYSSPNAGVSIAAIPEPASMTLLLICGAMLSNRMMKRAA